MDCWTDFALILFVVGIMLWILLLFIAGFLHVLEKEYFQTQVLSGGQAYLHCI